MDEIAQKVQARYAELPPDIKQAIDAADLDARVQTLGTKHKLHIDQMGKLQNEVLLVMLGFEDSDAFVHNLTSVMGVPPPQATALTTDINNEIFGPIRESLKKFTASKTAPASAAPTVPAPAASPAPATPAPKPQVPMAPHPHDLMLVEKTVTTPPAPKTPAPPPPKPQDYKADPYREPIGP